MFVNYGDTVAEMRCQGLPVQDTLTLLKLDPFSANFFGSFFVKLLLRTGRSKCYMCPCSLHLCSVTLGHLKRFIIVFQTSGGGHLNLVPMGSITQPTFFSTSPEDNENSVCFCVCARVRLLRHFPARHISLHISRCKSVLLEITNADIF